MATMDSPNTCAGGVRIYGVFNINNLEKCHVSVEGLDSMYKL